MNSTTHEICVLASQLGQLPYGLLPLEHLELGHSSISGALPTELAQLTQLRTIDVRSSALSHLLPSELGLLPNLQT